MYTIKRYVTRILIPFLVVVVIALVLRFVTTMRFNENRVTFKPPTSDESDSVTSWEDIETDAPYDSEAKERLVARIQTASSKIDAAVNLAAGDASNAVTAQIESESERLAKALDQLEQADATNWEQRRREALAALRGYANAVESLSSGESS